MTVADLIAKLQKVPEDTVVMVNGYEGDYTLLKEENISQMLLVHKGYNPEYFGEYEEPIFAEDIANAVTALVLGRY